MLTDDNIRRGMTPDAGAPRGADSRRRSDRPSRSSIGRRAGCPHSRACLQDLRFACRLIATANAGFPPRRSRRSRCGIGVNAIGFTIVNAAFLRMPAVRGLGPALRAVLADALLGSAPTCLMPSFRNGAPGAASFAGVAAYVEGPMNISDDRALPEQARGTWLTANAFGVLEAAAASGRDFVAGDERPGAEPVVIIGYSIWRNRYGSDPDVLGKIAARERPARHRSSG